MKFLFTLLLLVQTYTEVMRIKKVVSKDEMSWYLDKFSLVVPQEMYGER